MAKTRKKPRQQFIPGAEPLDIPELNDAMETYHDLKRQRMSLLEEEVEAKEEVKRLMHEHDLTLYVDQSASPELEAKREAETEEKVSVKEKKPKPVGDNGDE